MDESVFFMLGLALGGLAIALFMSGTRTWKSARGLMAAPAKAKKKYADEKKKARESVAKGRRQYLLSTLYFLGGLLIIGLILLIALQWL